MLRRLRRRRRPRRRRRRVRASRCGNIVARVRRGAAGLGRAVGDADRRRQPRVWCASGPTPSLRDMRATVAVLIDRPRAAKRALGPSGRHAPLRVSRRRGWVIRATTASCRADRRRRTVTPGRCARHPRRGVLLHALGSEEPSGGGGRRRRPGCSDGDAFLLCTDGLWERDRRGGDGAPARRCGERCRLAGGDRGRGAGPRPRAPRQLQRRCRRRQRTGDATRLDPL